MAQSQIPKWQKQIEEMLKEQFNEDELDPVGEKVNELFQMANQVERPQDETWEAVKAIVHAAIENLKPLTVAYLCFQLGAAYEKLRNAKRA